MLHIETINVYLSGGMQSFGKENFNESNNWRKYCKNTLENLVDFFHINQWKKFTCECDYKVKAFNPNDYFNFYDEPQYVSEREVMNFDLYNLRKADLVIVNFNDPRSIGTACELAIAHDIGIPIIGVNESGAELHPWLECMCERIFKDIDEMLGYVGDFYLK